MKNKEGAHANLPVYKGVHGWQNKRAKQLFANLCPYNPLTAVKTAQVGWMARKGAFVMQERTWRT